ncbi:hypothetical protein [Candidatus Karelsulcia muelleri]|uniref:Uncharacterized protein n=1 Tax=Candidatus Karelsulcia muelleri TaxID=336810 RepID=A0A3A1MMF7_9FLAO|nr:hypothetical protein [Candidatus Karelsulcia muelleri]RIU86104.1 hypothetical protein D2A33_00205 [Candidatus Karelsulcia muelleri]
MIKKYLNKIISIILLYSFNYNIIYYFYNDDVNILKLYVFLFVIKFISYNISYIFVKKTTNFSYYFVLFFIKLIINILIVYYMIYKFSLSNEFIIHNYIINYFSSKLIENINFFYRNKKHI